MNTPDQPITTTIDGVEYICHVQAAIPSNQSLIRLLGVVSAPAIHLLSGAVEGLGRDDKGEITLDGLGDIDFAAGLMMLFQELTPASATVILQQGFLGITTASTPVGKDLSDEDELNSHFRGSILRMYKVFAWSLRCNYRDFLGVASPGNINRLTALAKTLKSSKPKQQDTGDSPPSTSPTATPPSTDLSASAIQ